MWVCCRIALKVGKGNNEELVNVDARNVGVADVVQVTYGETDPPEFL